MALVPCALDSVRVHDLTRQHVVVLRPSGSTRVLPIWIGPDTARAISVSLSGASSERPLTHDFMATALAKLGVRVIRVVVRELGPGADDLGLYDLFAIAPLPDGSLAVGAAGAILRQSAAGWQPYARGIEEDLFAVVGFSGTSAWTVGSGGVGAPGTNVRTRPNSRRRSSTLSSGKYSAKGRSRSLS